MILLCNCSLSLNVCNIGLQCNLRFLSTTAFAYWAESDYGLSTGQHAVLLEGEHNSFTRYGSVATRMNRGQIFNDFLIANLLLSVMVKEF